MRPSVRPDTKRLLEQAKEPGESFDATIRRKLQEAERANEDAFLREVNTLLADRDQMQPLGERWSTGSLRPPVPKKSWMGCPVRSPTGFGRASACGGATLHPG